MGLPILENTGTVDGIEDGHKIKLDLGNGQITNRPTGRRLGGEIHV
jgi:hypothetical protein